MTIQERHRYFELANEDVALILESFLAISPPPKIRSLRQSNQLKLLQNARTCYDHLAGKLGVALTESLVASNYITLEEKNFVLTSEGEKFFTEFGLDLKDLKRKRKTANSSGEA